MPYSLKIIIILPLVHQLFIVSTDLLESINNEMVLFISGLKKGDSVAIYMPMIFEIIIATLACARLGVIHSIVVCYLVCCLI